MQTFKNLCSILLLCVVAEMLPAQEAIVQVYDNREEFHHISRMSDGNLLISGMANELGNKSDLVLICDPQGREISRSIICESCAPDAIVYSRETATGDIIHIRTNGGVYTSDLAITETTLNYNIARDEFESIETYQVLQNNHFIVVVSYAVKNSIRGLLHSVIDTRNKSLITQKFNVTFPDIAGSIGIDLFSDQSVIDGYNEDVNGVSQGHLLRLGRDRSELIWEVDLDFGDIHLEDAVVSREEEIYAVGRMVDVHNPDSWLALMVHYNGDGEFLSVNTYKAGMSNNDLFDYHSRNFANIEQVANDRFVITGYQAGDFAGETLTDALVVEVDSEGEVIKENVLHLGESSLFANDFLYENGEIIYIGTINDGNFINGSFISLLDSSVATEDKPAIGFNLIPNPAKEEIMVLGMEGEDIFSVTISDMNGKLISETSSKTTIPIQHISGGSYLLTVQLENGLRSTRKFIKI